MPHGQDTKGKRQRAIKEPSPPACVILPLQAPSVRRTAAPAPCTGTGQVRARCPRALRRPRQPGLPSVGREPGRRGVQGEGPGWQCPCQGPDCQSGPPRMPAAAQANQANQAKQRRGRRKAQTSSRTCAVRAHAVTQRGHTAFIPSTRTCPRGNSKRQACNPPDVASDPGPPAPWPQ